MVEQWCWGGGVLGPSLVVSVHSLDGKGDWFFSLGVLDGGFLPFIVFYLCPQILGVVALRGLFI